MLILHSGGKGFLDLPVVIIRAAEYGFDLFRRDGAGAEHGGFLPRQVNDGAFNAHVGVAAVKDQGDLAV